MSSNPDWHTVTINVPFTSEKHAIIAQKTIQVDSELQPQSVHRTISVQDNILIGTFQTSTVRLARLTVNSFLENVDLVVRTLSEFGEEAEKS